MNNEVPIKILDNTILEKVKIIASALIKNSQGKVLAIKLKDTDGKDMYISPGGRPEQGETLRECVIREVKEEVNLAVSIISIVGVQEKAYEDGIWTIVYYDAMIVSGDVTNNEQEEIQEIDWIEVKDLDGAEKINWVK